MLEDASNITLFVCIPALRAICIEIPLDFELRICRNDLAKFCGCASFEENGVAEGAHALTISKTTNAAKNLRICMAYITEHLRLGLWNSFDSNMDPLSSC
jgi:hypothetical protein